MMKLTVKDNLNIRIGKASVNAPNHEYYEPGTLVEIQNPISGDSINGNSLWFRDSNNNYLWSGGLYHDFWYISDFGIDKIWEQTKGENVTIILLDSGFTSSIDLSSEKVEKQFIPPLINGNDSFFHGTLMATIIAGSGHEILGVAPLSEIISVKITEQGQLTSKELIKGLEKVSSIIQPNKSYVINCSLALPLTINQADRDSIITLINSLSSQKNVIINSAVGNRPINEETIPASINKVISCSALRKSNGYIRLGHSNYWETITVTAPGEFPITELRNIFSGNLDSQGSSHACAYTSGIIALFLSQAIKKGKDFYYAEIKTLVMASADRVNSGEYKYNQFNRDKLLQSFNSI